MDKFVTKRVDASLAGVKKWGTRGIILELDHTVIGRKHDTHVRQEIHLSLCDMEIIGGRFHAIMDHLLEQWNSTKQAISGN